MFFGSKKPIIFRLPSLWEGWIWFLGQKDRPTLGGNSPFFIMVRLLTFCRNLKPNCYFLAHTNSSIFYKENCVSTVTVCCMLPLHPCDPYLDCKHTTVFYFITGKLLTSVMLIVHKRETIHSICIKKSHYKLP